MNTQQIALTRVIRSRWQPRAEAFDEELLWGLACSIRENGLINPVIVFPVSGVSQWELVAGERRVRAVAGLAWSKVDKGVTAKHAVMTLAREGLAALTETVRERLLEASATITANVEPNDDLERLHRVAVVENLERESLSAFEEARALQGLAKEYDWSQRELAKRIGKSQSYVAQRFALLGVSEEVKEAVSMRTLTATHARAIARVPQELQPAVTKWAMSAVGREDTPATTRQVQNRARQVAAFVEPGRWATNEEKVYRPNERNKLALVQWAIENADMDECAEALLALAAEGYSKSNWLAKKPLHLVRSEYGLGAVLAALGHKSFVIAVWKEEFAEQARRMCETCILSEIALDDRAEMSVHCDRWMGQSPVSCLGWIGVDDPIVIPLSYELQNWFKELDIEYQMEPFEHITMIGPYLTGVALAAVRKREAEEARAEKKATKHITAIQAFVDWQASQPEGRLAHFQAHACSKCVHQRDEVDAPCRFALEPLTARHGGGLRAPEFGILVGEDGQMYPRCEQFAYRDVPPIFKHKKARFAKPAQAVEWLHGLASRGSYGDQGATWGVLRWLDYGQQPGQSTDFDKLKCWIKRNWDELGGDEAVATLLDVALSEGRMRASSRQPYKLLDPTTNEVERFAVVDWRAVLSDSGYFGTYGYPADWLRPWETGEEGDDERDDG